MHDLTLITTVAAGFTAAWFFGLVTQRMGLSPIVGYLLAGVAIGPNSPGFTGDLHVAQQLAEVGVILMMFGVGLHFHWKDLLAVKNVAVPGAVVQSAAATAVSMLIFTALGLPLKTGAVIGMAMAVASTVVLMRVLMDANSLNTPQGHVAVGWLIVEDIFTVVLLVLIPVLGVSPSPAERAEVAGIPLWQTLGLALLKLTALVGIVLLAGSRLIPGMLVRVARLRSRELFTLTVLVLSIAIAVGSYFLFGASMALGAFLAGMVVAQSPVSHQAAADALPMRDAFSVLFFVSVGMLFDPAFLLEQPLMVAAALLIILIVKPAAALLIVGLLGHSVRTALTVAIGLAQIGEFSFILSDLARRYGLMPDAGHNMLVAGSILSITLNPILFRQLPAIENWLRNKPRLWRLLNSRAERRMLADNQAQARALSESRLAPNLAIVVGYGPVGRSVHRLLREANLATVVLDMNMDTVSALRAEGQAAIFGDASHETILEQAGIREASHLVLTLPHSTERSAVVAAARRLNRNVRILVRARYLREREDLEHAGANAAVFEEAEAAVALARLVLADTGLHRGAADRKIRDLRLQLITENIANIGSQRVRSVMVPWSRVRWLSALASRDAVLAQVSQERFSRWPVVEASTGKVNGYLLTKDLIARAADADWLRLVRPLGTVSPDETVEAVLARMQSEGASVYVVQDGDRPVGLITLEDILEQVVGQIEDEYPHEVLASLQDAILRGSVLLDLQAEEPADAIRELVQSIPTDRLPMDVAKEDVVRMILDRERDFSTNLGNGAAIPHARLPGLAAPVVAVGRSTSGIRFGAEAAEPVRVVFLLITPAEQPETQLALLSQVAQAWGDTRIREKLLTHQSAGDVTTVLGQIPR